MDELTFEQDDTVYKPLRVLIDGDMFAYIACQKTEDDIAWDGGAGNVYSRYTNIDEAFSTYMAMVDEAIAAALSEYKQNVRVFPCHLFSDLHYFRMVVNPTYKAGRAQTNKPVGYRALLDKIDKAFRVIVYKELEADDAIGILATRYPSESLIITGDKDMRTIPAPQYDFLRKEYKVITPEEAHKNFLIQALAGDATDGYSGCPGVGDKTARKLFDKNGWTWETIVNAYKDKGLTETDALRNARCAYILHNEDYDVGKGVVHLWKPQTQS